MTTTQLITEADIHQFLKIRMAEETRTTPDHIDVHTPLSAYRLDSITTVALAVDLEEWLGTPLDPSVFWEFDTIGDLATWLVSEYLPERA